MYAVNTSVTWGIPSGAPWWCRAWQHPQWEEHTLCAVRGTDVCSGKCTDCVQWEGPDFLQYKFAIARSSLNMLMCFNLQLFYRCMFGNLFCCRVLCQPIIQLPISKWSCDCRELWLSRPWHCFRVWTSLTLLTVWKALTVICRPVEVSNFSIVIDVLWLFPLDIPWLTVHYFRWVSVCEPRAWSAIG